MRMPAIARKHVLAAVVLALGGTLLFGVLHALVIVPIWWSLAAGLWRALITSIGLVWCYSAMLEEGRVRRGPIAGMLFGACVWLGLLPLSLYVAVLRTTGIRQRMGWMEPPLDLAMAALVGAAVGWALTRSRRATIAAAACLPAVLVTMNAPFVLEGARVQRLLWLGYLPIYLAAGLVLALLLGRCRHPLPPARHFGDNATPTANPA